MSDIPYNDDNDAETRFLSLEDDGLANDDIAVELDGFDGDKALESFLAAKDTLAQNLHSEEEIIPDAVSKMSSERREESVEIAREILRKLKVKLGEVLIHGELAPKMLGKEDIQQALDGLTDMYEFVLAHVRVMDEKLAELDIVYLANQALGQLQYHATQFAMEQAQQQNDHHAAQKHQQQIDSMPERWKEHSKETFGELLTAVEEGLKMLSSRMQRLSPDEFAENWRGMVNFDPVGGRKQEESEKRERRNIRMLMEEEYQQQVQAKRAAQQQMGTQVNQSAVRQQSQQKSSSQQSSMNKLISPDLMKQFQNSIKNVPANAMPVQVGIQENIRRSVKQNQQRMIQQRDKQSRDKVHRERSQRMDAKEARSDAMDAADDNSPSIEPPTGRRDRSRGR